LLLQSTEQLDLTRVSLGALDALVEYDRRTNSELTKTLEVYLQCNGNITKATKALHIHRNTMKYRLEKIVDLSGIDLDDAEQRFELQLSARSTARRPSATPSTHRVPGRRWQPASQNLGSRPWPLRRKRPDPDHLALPRHPIPHFQPLPDAGALSS
jgi:hypothetical protein